MRLATPLAAALGLALFAALATPSLAALRDLWPFGQKAEEPVPDPFPYEVTLEAPDAPRKLVKAIRRASVLIDRQKSPPSGVTGLVARARQDLGRITGTLYEEAHYGAEIAIAINGMPLEEIDPFADIRQPAAVTIRVTAGPPFTFGRVGAAPLPDGLTLEDLGLIPGEAAGSATVLAAETRLADAWRQRGHPLVRILPRDTIADHARAAFDVALYVEPGPQARFGRVTVEGAETVDPELIAGRAHLGDGLYSSKRTRAAEQRLRDLGVFGSVRARPGERLDPDGTIPITITVTERKPRVVGASVSYSNTEGAAVGAWWRHRNLFGGAEQLSFSASLSRLAFGDGFDPDWRLAGTFLKPGVFTPMTDFTFRLEGYRETTEAYRVRAVETEAGLAHMFSDTLSGAAGIELGYQQTRDDAGREETSLLATLNTRLTWDARDDKLDPSSGFRGTLAASPAYNFTTRTPFATLGADFSIYRAFGRGDRFVLAGRAAAEMLTVGDIFAVPADKRLYSGGAGTVRGYGFKNIAPRDTNGDLIGGRSTLLLSGELRYRLTDTIGLVAFVDAGNAYPGLIPDPTDLRIGVGAGLRYLTPVGPIRLDVAMPLQPQQDDPSFAFYIGLGQAF